MILNIDKPYGWTSTDVVRKLRNVMLRAGYPKRVKVGHAGTLDPLATGVLVLCTQKDTKKVTELQAQSKEYIFTLELGATTVSFDLEHPISERFPTEHITAEMIESVVASLKGVQMQVPPLYSAKRIAGKRAYELARKGVGEAESGIKAAEVEIYDIEVLSIEMPFVTIRTECSKGTYVRSLARDIGLELESGAYLTELRRSRSGEFLASEALSVEAASEVLSVPPVLAAE